SPAAGDDVRRQLADLLRPGFLFETGGDWLRQYPRYLKAAAARLENLPGYPDRDAEITAETRLLLEAWDRLATARAAMTAEGRAELEKCRFMVEEYRVSSFAQVLKTLMPVTVKGIEAQLARAKSLFPCHAT